MSKLTPINEKMWVCTYCDHIVEQKEQPKVCDKCFFKDSFEEIDTPESFRDMKESNKQMETWVCCFCNLEYHGAEPPQACPKCQVENSFELESTLTNTGAQKQLEKSSQTIEEVKAAYKEFKGKAKSSGGWLSQEIEDTHNAAEEIVAKGTEFVDSTEDGKTSTIQLPGQTGFSGGTGNQVNRTTPKWMLCQHKPTHIIEGNGWSVWAGKKLDVVDYARNFDILLNLTGYSVKEKHTIPIPELKKWETFSNTKEILLDWADMDVVSLPYQFWNDLLNYIEKNKMKMLTFCIGGHGRTGTALAAMLVTIGWGAEEAIKYIRTYYCDAAIENRDQEDYVFLIEKQKRNAEKREAKNNKKIAKTTKNNDKSESKTENKSDTAKA